MSFFGRIGIASQERIHSQVLSWFFSHECDALSKADKLKLIKQISNNQLNPTSILKVTTEEDNIDIIVYTNDGLLVFENKIKSTVHDDQLTKYEEIIEKKKIDNVFFVYLALFNEDIGEEHWNVLTHYQMGMLFKTLPLHENSDGIIFKDYLEYYLQLGQASKMFLEEPLSFKRVFTDGVLKKNDKDHIQYKSELERFICMNQLETIFQQIFYKNLVQRLGEDNYLISETRGNALLNIYAVEIIHNKKTFQIGIQLQRNSLKVIFQDKEYNKSKSADLPHSIINYFETNHFHSPTEKMNHPTSKCYMSKSSNFSWGYELKSEHIKRIKNLLVSLRENHKSKISELL